MDEKKQNVSEMIRELEALVDQKRELSRDQTRLRNEESEVGKKIDAKRKEIAKEILNLDRDLGYVIGTEYGLVTDPERFKVNKIESLPVA